MIGPMIYFIRMKKRKAFLHDLFLLTYLTVISTIETYVYKCKKYKTSNIYIEMRAAERKKKKVISRVHSIYFSSFFSLSTLFLY